MRAISFLTLAVAMMITAGCQTPSATGKSGLPASGLESLVYPPIKTDIPIPQRATLNNGVKVLMISDDELPLVNVTVMFKAGSAWEPADKRGLAGLTGALMRTGGAGEHSSDSIDEKLEEMAALLSVTIGQESGTASLSTLAKDIDQGLSLLADVIMRPRFEQKRFATARKIAVDGVRRQNDSPTGAALRKLYEHIYAGSPYGQSPTEETLTAISRDDLAAFHKKFVTPENMIIGVTGDFDDKEMAGKLQALFGQWTAPAATYDDPPAPTPAPGGIYLAHKKVPQAVIRAGHLVEVTRRDSDYYAARILDEILGGNGFASRLTQEIRVKRGLAYAVWSYMIAGRWEKGKFITGAETKTESAGEVVSIMRAEVEKIAEQGVTDKELETAKKTMVNSFIFIFDTPQRVMGEWLTATYYGLPERYLLDYRDKMMAVTSDDLQKAACKYLDPGALVFMVVGDEAGLTDQLGAIGPVTAVSFDDDRSPTSQGGKK